MLLLLISFLSGILTVLAPCVLPLLPVIIGQSFAGTTPHRSRLFVVITSLALSVTFFTLLLKVSSLLIAVPQDFWTWLSGAIIFFFGLTMLFPAIWERFSLAHALSLRSNKALESGYRKNNLWGDVIIGASLGPIFSACSPTYFVILGTVLPASPVLGLVYLLTYVLGLALTLLCIAFLGQGIMRKLGPASDPRGWFKKTLGCIFILLALAIISGYDKKLQIGILNLGFIDVTKIEQRLLDAELKLKSQNQNQSLQMSDKPLDQVNNQSFLSLAQKQKTYTLAPDLSSIDAYLNTNDLPITLNQYKGQKVVLLDIWTYSCINCRRTIPYLNEWHKKYEDDGLVIIGLHTPEFAFEKVRQNVESAVTELGIKYPVVLDNDFSTWRAYNNRYWPRKYLIDIDGFIVYDHAGEGQYEETELQIQKALTERNYRLNQSVSVSGDQPQLLPIASANLSKVRSPEIYFGSARNEYLGYGQKGREGKQSLVLPSVIRPNKLYLQGTWHIDPEYSKNETAASIVFKYEAKNVYITAGSADGVEVEIYQDDVFVKRINIKQETIYQLIEGDDYAQHTLRLVIPQAGLRAFTFTFG